MAIPAAIAKLRKETHHLSAVVSTASPPPSACSNSSLGCLLRRSARPLPMCLLAFGSDLQRLQADALFEAAKSVHVKGAWADVLQKAARGFEERSSALVIAKPKLSHSHSHRPAQLRSFMQSRLDARTYACCEPRDFWDFVRRLVFVLGCQLYDTR